MITLPYVQQLVKPKYRKVVSNYVKIVADLDPFFVMANLVKLDCLEDGWEQSLNTTLQYSYGTTYYEEDDEHAAQLNSHAEYNIYKGDDNILVMPAQAVAKEEIQSKQFLNNVKGVKFILPYKRADFQPSIRLMTDIILQDAKDVRATDIHIVSESNNDTTFSYTVGFRKGIYVEKQERYHLTAQMVDEMVKDLLVNRSSVEHKFADMIIQSGVRFRLVDEDFPARCQVANSIAGKTLVMRMFDFSEAPSIPKLGFSREGQRMLDSVSTLTSGLTLVSGVFGSGKGTTLNAVGMRMEEAGNLAIASLDDPIEYLRKYPQYEYSSEEQLNQFIDSFKKMDLNVVFLNEIILNPVADAVFNLVAAGVHVLSTIHASRVYKIMYKIRELFGRNYLNLIPFINVLTYQDKFSVTCKACSTGTAIDAYAVGSDEEKLLTFLNLTTFKQPTGCHECNHGIIPVGIKVFSEHVIFNDTIKDALLKKDIHEQLEYLKELNTAGNSLEKELREALINGDVLIKEVLKKLDTWR